MTIKLELDEKDLKQAIAEVVVRKAFGVKTPSGAWGAQPLHGTGGLFTMERAEAPFISLRVTPRGLGDVLPVKPTVYEEPLQGFITGVDSLADPSSTSTACEDCQSGGETETCRIHWPLGRVCFETKEVEINRAAARFDRLDVDFDLLNELIGEPNNPYIPGVTRLSQRDMLNVVLAMEMVELGIEFQSTLNPMLWTGNPANNNPPGVSPFQTGYAEFRGLQLLVATGHVDASTNTACPSLDSDVKDFGWRDVCTDTTPTIAHYLAEVERIVTDRARRQYLDPVEHVVVMRPDLFYEFSRCYPCMYNTLGCVPLAGATPMFDVTEQRKETFRIRSEQTIPINGRMYRVILDDSIPEYNDNNDPGDHLVPGQYASDIYFLPLTYRGNRPALYWEYFDFRTTDQQLGPLGNLGLRNALPVGWTDTGRFHWAVLNNGGWCFVAKAKVMPRIILKTPHLAGRIQNVRYTPLQHSDGWLPDDPYFRKGGISVPATEVPQYYPR
jgi:hypothetical protein